MRIYSLSRIIGIPVGLMTAYVAYNIFFSYDTLPLYVVLTPVIIIVALFLFNTHIDHWYLKRNPMPADPVIKDWLKKHDAFYKRLHPDKKIIFEHRLNLYQHGRAFEAVVNKGTHDVPYDIACFISAQAVKLTFNREDYLMGDMDRIFLYKHPFPSPRYKFLHTFETQIEDGVLIFALDHLIPGLTQGDKFYNICMHGYADAYIKVYTDVDWPDQALLNWQDVEQMSGFKKEQILKVLGYESIDLLPIYITYYFTYPEKLNTVSIPVFNDLERIFTA